MSNVSVIAGDRQRHRTSIRSTMPRTTGSTRCRLTAKSWSTASGKLSGVKNATYRCAGTHEAADIAKEGASILTTTIAKSSRSSIARRPTLPIAEPAPIVFRPQEARETIRPGRLRAATDRGAARLCVHDSQRPDASRFTPSAIAIELPTTSAVVTGGPPREPRDIRSILPRPTSCVQR